MEKVVLPPSQRLYEYRESLKKSDSLYFVNNDIARKMAFLDRMESGVKIDIGMLKANDVRILFMPGELFVEYQLAAKAERPDLHIAMAAYGDLGPEYIGTSIQYEKGGYEASDASNVSPDAESILFDVIKKLLNK